MRTADYQIRLEYFHKIYIQYSKELNQHASRYVGIYEGEDIVQDVFLRIWDKQLYILPDEEIRKMLFVSVRNKCIDFLRKQVPQEDIERQEIQLKIEELLWQEKKEEYTFDQEKMDLLMAKINELPEKCRKIFCMSYLDNLKNNDIARIENLSIRTVENQLYRAVQTLRKSCSHILASLFL